MLQPSFRTGDLIGKPAGSDVILEESRVLAGSINESPDTLTFTPAELGANISVMKISYAKNFTVFSRGDVYYHEGLSLQENVVPMITVKLQEEKKRTEFQVELIYKGKKGGTVYTLRPVIEIRVYTNDAFAEDVHLKLNVTDGQGNVIGKPKEGFYNDVTQLIDIPENVSSGRQPISIEEDYHGSSITITALNPETNATLSTLKLDFEID
jgi:hypothetical protein